MFPEQSIKKIFVKKIALCSEIGLGQVLIFLQEGHNVKTKSTKPAITVKIEESCLFHQRLPFTLTRVRWGAQLRCSIWERIQLRRSSGE